MDIALLQQHLVISEFNLLSREEVQASLLTPTLLPHAGTWAVQEQIFAATAEEKETFVALGLFSSVFCYDITRRPSCSFVFHWLQMSPEHLFWLLVTLVWSCEKSLPTSSSGCWETAEQSRMQPHWPFFSRVTQVSCAAFPHIIYVLSACSPGPSSHLL